MRRTLVLALAVAAALLLGVSRNQDTSRTFTTFDTDRDGTPDRAVVNGDWTGPDCMGVKDYYANLNDIHCAFQKVDDDDDRPAIVELAGGPYTAAGMLEADLLTYRSLIVMPAGAQLRCDPNVVIQGPDETHLAARTSDLRIITMGEYVDQATRTTIDSSPTQTDDYVLTNCHIGYDLPASYSSAAWATTNIFGVYAQNVDGLIAEGNVLTDTSHSAFYFRSVLGARVVRNTFGDGVGGANDTELQVQHGLYGFGANGNDVDDWVVQENICTEAGGDCIHFRADYHCDNNPGLVCTLTGGECGAGTCQQAAVRNVSVIGNVLSGAQRACMGVESVRGGAFIGNVCRNAPQSIFVPDASTNCDAADPDSGSTCDVVFAGNTHVEPTATESSHVEIGKNAVRISLIDTVVQAAGDSLGGSGGCVRIWGGTDDLVIKNLRVTECGDNGLYYPDAALDYLDHDLSGVYIDGYGASVPDYGFRTIVGSVIKGFTLSDFDIANNDGDVGTAVIRLDSDEITDFTMKGGVIDGDGGSISGIYVDGTGTPAFTRFNLDDITFRAFNGAAGETNLINFTDTATTITDSVWSNLKEVDYDAGASHDSPCYRLEMAAGNVDGLSLKNNECLLTGDDALITIGGSAQIDEFGPETDQKIVTATDPAATPSCNYDGAKIYYDNGDATDAQFTCVNGAWASLDGAELSWNITLEAPADTDDFCFARAEADLTVSRLDCVAQGGTTPSFPVTISECDSACASCADGGISVTADGGLDSDTTFSDAAIDDGDYMEFSIGTSSGSADWLSCTVTYDLD